MCVSPRDGSSASRCRCSSGRCTRPGTRCTSRASSRAHHRTSLEGGASLGIHESQSRLWENLVGRSRPFWEHFFPALQARFPSQLGGVTLDQFYRGINRVRPSLIRVEADEATYNLHVMLRVELEIALLDGTRRGARSARGLAHAHAGVSRPHAAR